jgi:hypothetical protein
MPAYVLPQRNRDRKEDLTMKWTNAAGAVTVCLLGLGTPPAEAQGRRNRTPSRKKTASPARPDWVCTGPDLYPSPRGNLVFNASTIFWSQGLGSPPGHMLPWSQWSRPHGPDERVQRITRNVLKRALGEVENGRR